VQIVLKSGSLNLLEPSGPVQDCNGIAFYIYITPRNVSFIIYSGIHHAIVFTLRLLNDAYNNSDFIGRNFIISEL
jgi:hypothetical protein